MHELLTEARYLWHGPRNYVRLDPQSIPAQIFRVRRHMRREHDFDYFM
jgi:starch synthase (maltosyl-transferring)